MSNIEPNIIDPGKGPIPPTIDPNDDGLVEPDDVREPDSDNPPIEPDPEEGGHGTPPLRN
jgi:hypothetical protein